MEPSVDPPPRFTLRPSDQSAAGLVIACALAAMLFHYLYHGGHRGRLLEIDRVQPGTIEFTVDVNSAEWPELTVLPEVGETLAKRIVESREQEGEFRTLDDLSRVRGIGPRTLERLKPYLRPLADPAATASHMRETSPPVGSN